MVAVTGVSYPPRGRALARAFLLALLAAALRGELAAGAQRPAGEAVRDSAASAEVPSCLDVARFANVVAREPEAAVLYLVKAVVRDAGGGERGEPVNVDLLVLGG